MRVALLVSVSAAAILVWASRDAGDAAAEVGEDKLRSAVVAHAEELKNTHGKVCAEVVSEDFLEPHLAGTLSKDAPLPVQVTALVAQVKGASAGFAEVYRTSEHVVLKSDLVRREVDKTAKHIVAEYIDVRRFGQNADARWEIVRTELLYLCDAEANPRSP